MQKTSVIICFLIIVFFPRIGVSQKGDTIYVPKKKATATPTVCDDCDKKEVPKKQKKAKVIKVKLKGFPRKPRLGLWPELLSFEICYL